MKLRLIFMLMSISVAAYAQDGDGDFSVKVKGFADSYHAVRCSKFLAQDYDDIQIPENALRLKFAKKSFSMDLVFAPVIETFEMPFEKENPWAISMTEILTRRNSLI